MSAFGKKGGAGGMKPNRPAFGVARPMKGGGSSAQPSGGEQFPPLPEEEATSSADRWLDSQAPGRSCYGAFGDDPARVSPY